MVGPQFGAMAEPGLRRHLQGGPGRTRSGETNGDADFPERHGRQGRRRRSRGLPARRCRPEKCVGRRAQRLGLQHLGSAELAPLWLRSAARAFSAFRRTAASSSARCARRRWHRGRRCGTTGNGRSSRPTSAFPGRDCRWQTRASGGPAGWRRWHSRDNPGRRRRRRWSRTSPSRAWPSWRQMPISQLVS